MIGILFWPAQHTLNTNLNLSTVRHLSNNDAWLRPRSSLQRWGIRYQWKDQEPRRTTEAMEKNDYCNARSQPLRSRLACCDNNDSMASSNIQAWTVGQYHHRALWVVDTKAPAQEMSQLIIKQRLSWRMWVWSSIGNHLTLPLSTELFIVKMLVQRSMLRGGLWAPQVRPFLVVHSLIQADTIKVLEMNITEEEAKKSGFDKHMQVITILDSLSVPTMTNLSQGQSQKRVWRRLSWKHRWASPSPLPGTRALQASHDLS